MAVRYVGPWPFKRAWEAWSAQGGGGHTFLLTEGGVVKEVKLARRCAPVKVQHAPLEVRGHARKLFPKTVGGINVVQFLGVRFQ